VPAAGRGPDHTPEGAVHTQQQQLSSLPCFTWSIQRIACVDHCSSLDNVFPVLPLCQRDRLLSSAAQYRAHARVAFDSSQTAWSCGVLYEAPVVAVGGTMLAGVLNVIRPASLMVWCVMCMVYDRE